MNKAESKKFLASPRAMQKWVDECQVCYIKDQLVAVPYKEALQVDNYALAGTVAAICANKFIRKLIETKF